MKTGVYAFLLACGLFCSTAMAQTIPPSPFGAACSAGDAVYSVNGFPSTPYALQNLFTQPFKNPAVASPINGKTCRDDGHCISSYEIEVKEIKAQPFNTVVPACAAKPGTDFLAYNNQIPGPTIIATAGEETIVRFKNNIGGRWNGTVHPCDAPGRSGRPFSVHLHGSASLAPFDGWAEDETCVGETKEYIYPNNRPVSGWYHDHALHITGQNAYYGMAGLYYVSSKAKYGGCGEPWNLEDVEELHMVFQDKVLDSECQMIFDQEGVHADDFYGDINLISGIPFPLFNLEPKFYRMRLLNAAVTRPYLFKIKTEAGVDVAHNMCHVIAADGGYRTKPVAFAASGLFIAAAERYEVVCDFGKYSGQTLYFANDKDEGVMRDTPYFCYSHLLGKVQVGSSGSGPAFEPASTAIAANQPLTRVMSDADIAQAQAMADAGQSHRTLKFGRSGGQWTINGHTWETFKIAAADVGQNTWEVWRFETGGGWYHPIHIHLIDLYILSRSKDGGVKTFEKGSPKDVFFLGPSQTVYIVARFGAHRGDYMFHCHNLRHEDNDMMRAMQVTATGPNAASAAAFIEVNEIVYNNFAYVDPMAVPTLAKPTAELPALTAAYERKVLADSWYRIFYPNATDIPILSGPNNPWKAQWKGHCAQLPPTLTTQAAVTAAIVSPPPPAVVEPVSVASSPPPPAVKPAIVQPTVVASPPPPTVQTLVESSATNSKKKVKTPKPPPPPKQPKKAKKTGRKLSMA